jgi:tetratricopeptide (TPR) repeat protein
MDGNKGIDKLRIRKTPYFFEAKGMKKSLFQLWWIIFILFLSSTSLRAQENLSAIVNRVEPSIVTVFAYDQAGNTINQGRGFFISGKGDVIANRNVLKGADHADVRIIDGMLYPVRLVLAEDREVNLIRLWVEIPSAAHPLSLSSSFPNLGERVAVIGGRVQSEKLVSYGTVSAVQEIPTLGKIIRLTPPVSKSFNVSPVVNMKGEVIGVVTSWMVEGQNFTFVVPSQRIISLKVRKGISLAEWEERKEETAEGLYAKGLPFLWKEGYEKALLYFEVAVKKDPRYSNAYFLIGYTNAQLGRYPDALDAYKKAIQIQPDFVFAHFYLGLIYLEMRDRNHALEEYKILKNLNRDYARDLLNMIR